MCEILKVGDKVDEFAVSEGPIAKSESCVVYVIVDKEKSAYALKCIKKDKVNHFKTLDKVESSYLMRTKRLVVKNLSEFELFVMKYCDDNLEMRIKKIKELRGEFLSSGILEDFGQMSVGLFVLHRKGISHCNINPRNIFFDNGMCKLGNFGTSVKENGEEIRKYVAPEAFSNFPTIDEKKCDIFSLGAVVFELIELIPLPRDEDFPFNPIEPCVFKNDWEEMPATVKDLIARMVSTSPETRPTIEDVMRHSVIRKLIQTFPGVSVPEDLKTFYVNQ